MGRQSFSSFGIASDPSFSSFLLGSKEPCGCPFRNLCPFVDRNLLYLDFGRVLLHVPVVGVELAHLQVLFQLASL